LKSCGACAEAAVVMHNATDAHASALCTREQIDDIGRLPSVKWNRRGF
jgi:hypothetical protein